MLYLRLTLIRFTLQHRVILLPTSRRLSLPIMGSRLLLLLLLFSLVVTLMTRVMHRVHRIVHMLHALAQFKRNVAKSNRPKQIRSSKSNNNYPFLTLIFFRGGIKSEVSYIQTTKQTKGSRVKFEESTVDNLTNKKREYLQNEIFDKNGKFSYQEDPSEYKKARKRMQNRESAVRSRMRKRHY